MKKTAHRYLLPLLAIVLLTAFVSCSKNSSVNNPVTPSNTQSTYFSDGIDQVPVDYLATPSQLNEATLINEATITVSAAVSNELTNSFGVLVHMPPAHGHGHGDKDTSHNHDRDTLPPPPPGHGHDTLPPPPPGHGHDTLPPPPPGHGHDTLPPPPPGHGHDTLPPPPPGHNGNPFDSLGRNKDHFSDMMMFHQIFTRLQLTPQQDTLIYNLLSSYHDCVKTALTALQVSEKTILDNANAQRKVILANLKAGTIDRATALQQLKDLNKSTWDALTNNPLKASTQTAVCDCLKALLAGIRATLTPTQQVTWDAWVATLKGPCF